MKSEKRLQEMWGIRSPCGKLFGGGRDGVLGEREVEARTVSWLPQSWAEEPPIPNPSPWSRPAWPLGTPLNPSWELNPDVAWVASKPNEKELGPFKKFNDKSVVEKTVVEKIMLLKGSWKYLHLWVWNWGLRLDAILNTLTQHHLKKEGGPSS